MSKITIQYQDGSTFVRGPVSCRISELIRYARSQGLTFTSYRVVSDPFTAKFRTFGIQIFG